MNPVNWFEIPVKDIDRSKTFYEKVLGVKLELHEMGPMKMAWFPMKDKAPGATGSLVKDEHYNPSLNGIVIYFSVDDIDSVLDKASKNGGKILNKKMAIGEWGFIGHLQDSEGNCIGVHSMK